MKFLDKMLRWWRVGVALKAVPADVTAVFDIGCDDGYLLKRFKASHLRLDGCDPHLKISSVSANSHLYRGSFPSVVRGLQINGVYDVVFALAVFEHFTQQDLDRSSLMISKMLSENGLLIVTVPHPFVDKILDILIYLGLIDGQAIEEHHGFDPKSLVNTLSDHLKLKHKKKFQLGLNNIFVFEKIAPAHKVKISPNS